jgi:hypothetical protein
MFPWCYICLHCKNPLLCVVWRVDISKQHSAGGATMIAIIVGEEGLKEILLLRMDP